MIQPGANSYEVVLADRYYLRELTQSITLDESIDEISYRANIQLIAGEGWPAIGPGQEIRVSGLPFGGSDMVYLLHPGVIWEVENSYKGTDHLSVTVYDRTIYLAKSEDEYLFPEGQTASQRLMKYAEDWDLQVGNIPDTGIALSKAVYRSRSIYSCMMDDLKETAKKGGDLYRPRMTPNGLELYRLGSNETVWLLEPDRNVEEITQRRTIENAVTRVKVLGVQNGGASEEILSPVLVIEQGQTEQFGTLQKIISDPEIKTPAEGQKAAKAMLSAIEETFTVNAIDINTIRAGDKVDLAGSGLDLLVTSVKHELGDPGHMSLELATPEYVRRRYYHDGSL